MGGAGGLGVGGAVVTTGATAEGRAAAGRGVGVAVGAATAALCCTGGGAAGTPGQSWKGDQEQGHRTGQHSQGVRPAGQPGHRPRPRVPSPRPLRKKLPAAPASTFPFLEFWLSAGSHRLKALRGKVRTKKFTF